MDNDSRQYENMNYETLVDSFMPHMPRIIVEHPIHPEKRMEEQELRDKYKKIYAENGIK
ncbi:MAG: hypothetical protein NC313_05275 [Butyrivibrio sp.]|nr:hypothetical protein [Butyrivibrio sp.]